MKSISIALFMILFSCLNIVAQDTASSGQLMVWSEQGWMMKAKNTGSEKVVFRFTWTTTGTNSKGEVVSTLTDASQFITLNPGEERHLFTAPQDPNKNITYTFNHILINDYKTEPVKTELQIKQEEAERRRSYKCPTQ